MARARLALHVRILIGLGVGTATGLAANATLGGDDPRLAWAVANLAAPAGALFLRLLLMIVVPLVFTSLVLGVAGVGDLRRLGRIGLKSLAYTLAISAISVVIGLTLANLVRPGKRIDEATAGRLAQRYGADAGRRVEDARKAGRPGEDAPLMQVVKTVVPTNPVASVAADPPNMIHLMFVALLVGIAVTMLPAENTAPLLRGLQGVYDVTVRLIDLIMRLAPYAVACLLFGNTAQFGTDLVGTLVWYMGTVLAGLTIHMFGVYSLSVYLLSDLSPREFFRRVRLVLVTAFSTSSSNATLPTALRVSEQNLGVPSHINSFVLTVGATANQNGTALYEGVTVLFLAQLAGVDLSMGQQLVVVYFALLGSIGTAGVPSGSIPFVIAILSTLGISPELIAIILGVDRILDMCRTTLNVTGDITAATYVARSEGFTLLGSGEPRGPEPAGERP